MRGSRDEGPVGDYKFSMYATGKGLGYLYKDDDVLVSYDGGVAGGWASESSSVKDASNGTPYCDATTPHLDDRFVRARHEGPTLSWGNAGNGTSWDTGYAFPDTYLGRFCNALGAWMNATPKGGWPGPFFGLVQDPLGAFPGRSSFLNRLFKPEDASFECTEHDTGTNITDPQQGGQKVDLFIALEAYITFFSPDDLKRKRRELKQGLGESGFNASSLILKDDGYDPSSPTGADPSAPGNGCQQTGP